MSLRNIQYMHVVAKASPIWSVIIITEDVEMIALASCCLQKQRNDVGFRAMILAQGGSGSAGVKVTKSYYRPSIGPTVPIQDSFQHQLGFAVRVNGIFGMI